MRDGLVFLIVRFALPLALALCARPSYAQAQAQPPAPPPDGVAVLLNRLEQLLQQNNRDDFPSLISTPDITGEEAEQATDDLFSYETTRATVRERDRTQLETALPGNGYHVIVEILTETPARSLLSALPALGGRLRVGSRETANPVGTVATGCRSSPRMKGEDGIVTTFPNLRRCGVEATLPCILGNQDFRPNVR